MQYHILWSYIIGCHECSGIYNHIHVPIHVSLLFLCNRVSHVYITNSMRPSDVYVHRQSNDHWFRWWFVACSASSHCLNQCWNIVNWTLRNNLQWNISQTFSFKKMHLNKSSGKRRPCCLNLNLLMHWGLSKMATNFSDCISEHIFMNLLNLILMGPIVNKSSLVLVMAWCWTGPKPSWTNDDSFYWCI